MDLLDLEFPGQSSPEVRQSIERQESIDLLGDWFGSLARAATYDEFLQTLRR